MKKVAVRAMIALAAVVALSLFFSGTIRTLTTPKVRFLTPRQGKLEQITELTGKVHFPDEENLTLDLPEGATLTLNSVLVQPGDLVGQMSADVQTFKFRTETGAGKVERVSLERLRRCRFCVNRPLVNVGNVLFQSV